MLARRRGIVMNLRALFPFVVVFTTVACAPKRNEPREKIVTPVRVRLVEQRTELAGARYSGTVEPGTRVDVAFKVGGYVRELCQIKSGGTTRKIQEGDFVTKGTVLAVVRESEYVQHVGAGEAGLAEASAAERQAKLDFDRTEKLTASNSVAKVELEAEGTRLETARARVEGAKSRILEAKLALADCTVRAPIDGVVLKRPIEVGSLVAPGSVGFVIADTKSVKIVFGAPDRLVEKLKPGGSMGVAFDAVPGNFEGTITRIAPSADPKSRVFEIEATIPNPKDELRVGMIAKLVVPEGSLKEASLALPLTAVVRSPRDPRGFSVFVVETQGSRDVARQRDVKLGDVVGNAVIVVDGLKAKERVVSMGATLLNDGEPVNVIPS
jgi:multidrug efflux system membrane fusion protein